VYEAAYCSRSSANRTGKTRNCSGIWQENPDFQAAEKRRERRQDKAQKDEKAEFTR